MVLPPSSANSVFNLRHFSAGLSTLLEFYDLLKLCFLKTRTLVRSFGSRVVVASFIFILVDRELSWSRLPPSPLIDLTNHSISRTPVGAKSETPPRDSFPPLAGLQLRLRRSALHLVLSGLIEHGDDRPILYFRPTCSP